MGKRTPSPPGEIRVHVHHPDAGGRISLRVSTDWERDVEPVEVDQEAGRFEFVIETEEPFVYFKPVLRGDGGPRWAAGADRFATSGAARVWDVFPAFEEAPARVGELEQLGSEHGSWSYRVFLPANYDENTLHRYPVLYMNDGHNLFFREEAAVNAEWGVQDTLRQLVEMTSIEPVIAVGVYPGDREADYARHPGSRYPRFLAEHLKPHLDRRLRTLPGPEHTATLGSSLGGVAALACAWQHPEAFGMAGCLSATFGYADDLATQVLSEDKPEVRVYLDSGWPRDNYEVTRDMRARLAWAGFREGIDLLYFAFPGDRHSEHAWGDRCHVPFQFFFGERPSRRSSAGEHAAGAAQDA